MYISCMLCLLFYCVINNLFIILYRYYLLPSIMFYRYMNVSVL